MMATKPGDHRGHRVPADIRSLARSFCPSGIKELNRIAHHSENDNARVRAIEVLLERAYGKPEQSHELNAEIRITIRQLLDPLPRPGDDAKVIEHGD
jgi:hypothetical protein